MATLTELEDLRLFLQERVQEFDPSLDTSTGSSFDNNVIQPLLSRLGPDPYDTPIRDFIIGRLHTEFPDLVVQDGEPIDDYAVKIMQILLEPFRRQIEQISTNQSLAEPETLNEAEADNLAGNFFARRQVGGFSVGVARLYFSSPQFILVTPSNPVSSGDGLNFYPVENQSITADNMLFNTEDNLFYFDVAIRAAEEGQDYNIAPNTLVSVEGIPSAVKVVNQLAFEEGANKESTEEFIERVENSLSEKSLVTLRGISAKLRDVFENIRLIQVIGYGDPEMERDVITGGGEAQTYAVFLGDTPDTSGAGTPTINLNALQLTDGVAGHDDFTDAVVAVGDVVTAVDIAGQTLSEHTVTAVESSTELSVTPNVTDNLSSSYFMLKRASGGITLSDIPGGILQPITDAGEISLVDDQVHIGGVLDVFIRAGAPQNQNSTLEGVLDGRPLIFGVDLESFGEGDEDVFVHVTEKIVSHIAIPGLDRFGAALAKNDNLLVRQYYNPGGGGPYAPWVPTEADVGRYVQLLGGGTPGEWGTYKIEEILQEEYYLSVTQHRAVRIRVSTLDEETGVDSGGFTTDTGFSTDFRLVEKVSVTNRVRDRDGSRVAITGGSGDILAGRDFVAEGASIGDSVVIETADDAGIYSIRRILTWLDTNDTLILDRDLTRKVKPSGSGDGSGLRYRVADDLNVDLVEPRVTKMPLGNIFTASDLSTIAGSETVSVSGGDSNFLLAGVEEGDSLQILEGDDEGTYEIQTVAGTSLTLDTAMRNTATSLNFSTFRSLDGVSLPLVRVESVELLDSNSQPTGIQIPYGDVIDARVKGQFSNRAEGNILESYTAETKVGTGGKLVLLEDVNNDFVAAGVVPGYRLVLYSVPNNGNYVIKSVGTGDGLASDNQIEVELAADGGTEFRTAAVGAHYSVGLPSSGFARLYFQEPTTVEISTGLAGGRIQHTASGTTREYMFSSVDGRVLIPAGGSEDEVPRDLRVVSNYETSPGSGEYQTVVELTDETRPGVFELELQEGDVFEAFEQVPFRTTAGDTFAEAGVFGKAAGLRTVSGSNLVSVPSNSLIDFTAMDTVFPLAGQSLRIDSGPDEGEYVIEKVNSAKSLRLNAVMTATTESIAGQEVATPRDATLADSGSKTAITDTTDGTALGSQAGHFITIFESLRGDLDGTYEISDPSIGADAVEIDVSFDTPAGSPEDPLSVGDFSWVRTVLDTNVSQEFRIYNTIPSEFEVVQVATKRADVVGLELGDISSSTTFDDASGVNFVTEGVEQGDLLEIVSEAGVGVYYIASVAAAQLTIQASKPFSGTVSDQPYRIRGGLHGSRRMVTLGKYGVGDGKIDVSSLVPYRVKRPDVYRISSTEMEENFDGSLYYTDIQVESLGAGDALNLERRERLEVASGLRADGYTYSVVNNKLTFSPFEEVSLTFDRRFLPVGNSDSPENLTEISGRNIKISYETSTTVRLVHDLMRSEAERPVNANPLARHFLPSYVYVRLQYSGGVAAAEVGPDIEEYINSLGADSELEVSDLEAFITRRGADSVEHPIEIVVVTHDLDRKLVTDRTENKLGGGSSVPYNGTGRISAFFTTLGESLLVERES